MGGCFLLFCCLRKSGTRGSGLLLRSTILLYILSDVLVVVLFHLYAFIVVLFFFDGPLFDVGRAVVNDTDVVRRVWFDDVGVVLVGADVFDADADVDLFDVELDVLVLVDVGVAMGGAMGGKRFVADVFWRTPPTTITRFHLWD